jgi:hypothetical protein
MKDYITSVLMLCLVSLATCGCGEKTSSTTETKVSTPGGTTTVTVEKEVEKTGDNPPAEQP